MAEKQKKTVPRGSREIVSVSMTSRDRRKLRELAAKHEMTVSALLASLVRERYEAEFGGEKQENQ